MQGLDTKLLKSILKKESCYTTMMSTARIRGVDRVILLANNHYEPRLYKVTEEMTFGHLIGEACETEHLSLELLNNWYLEDKNKGMYKETINWGVLGPNISILPMALYGKGSFSESGHDRSFVL